MSEVKLINEAQSYYASGLEQLDRIILDDKHAKRMLLVGAIMAQNVILVGEPGGGKTTLSENINRMFHDMEPEEVQQVPASAELSDIQLVGGRMSSTESVTTNSDTVVTEHVIDVPALIDERAKILWLDEINRTNPHAINQLLPALENHRLITTAGKIELPNLLMAISTMNPSETDEATFKLASANTSRHSMGAILPLYKTPADRERRIRQVADDWDPKPEDMTAFIHTKELKQIGEWALRIKSQPEALNRIVDLVMKTNDKLRYELGIREADLRMTKQIRKNAKGFAAIDGRETVTVEAVEEAVKGTIVSRIASQKRMTVEEIDEFADSVLV